MIGKLSLLFFFFFAYRADHCQVLNSIPALESKAGAITTTPHKAIQRTGREKELLDASKRKS
jgi:hypothetical protein